MKIDDLLHEKFIRPALGHSHCNRKVGLEFEFPLICSKGIDSYQVVSCLFHSLLKDGFNAEYDSDGQIVGVQRIDIKITLDTSYNILECIFAPVVTIHKAVEIWQEIYPKLKLLLGKQARVLGLGIHPCIDSESATFLGNKVVQAEQQFLSTYTTGRSDFFAFIASLQTHLEFTTTTLPQAITLFAKLDFVEILLFANSPLATSEGFFYSGRHYFYTRSIFKSIGLAGSVNEPFTSLDDIINDYKQRAIFLRKRDTYEYFSPVSLETYFSDPIYDAQAADLDLFYSYRNIELRDWGTLERRITCTQPLNEIFAPVVFQLGISEVLAETEEIINRFLADYNIIDSNDRLCELAARGEFIVDKIALCKLLKDIWSLAIQGLQQRSYGESIYLPSFDSKLSKINKMIYTTE